MTNLICKAFEGHNIRIATDEQGEPWFVAKDVAVALGYRDAANMTRNLKEHQQGTQNVSTPGGAQKMAVLNEPGLYRVVLKSRIESAERFQDWVTDDVLPSIRKNGGYIAGQEQDTPELIMAKALIVAQSVIESKTIELQRAKEQIAIQAPKADFADRVAGADKGVLLGNFAKTVGIGPKKIFTILREMRILMKGGNRHNLPFQQFLDLGHFEVIEKPYEINGETRLAFSPTITGKGQQWLTHKLLAAGHLQAHAA